LKNLARQGHQHVMMVPIAFTSDHIETLYEIDIEYAEEAHEAGIITFARAPSLNDSDLLTSAQAELVADHLASGALCTPQYRLNCAGCINPVCRTILNPAAGQAYSKLRDSYGVQKEGGVPQWPTEQDKEACRTHEGRTV
jgi:ferrochelatase